MVQFTRQAFGEKSNNASLYESSTVLVLCTVGDSEFYWPSQCGFELDKLVYFPHETVKCNPLRMIRKAKLEDAEAIAEIYNFYILNSVATFEETCVEVAEMSKRLQSITAKFPWTVFE